MSESGESDRRRQSSSRHTWGLTLPVRRRAPGNPVSPGPRIVFTIVVMVSTFVAGVLWLPPDLGDRIVEAVRASASAASE